MSGRGKSKRNLELIEIAREILEEVQPASVRAVCYQLFNRKLIPSMEKKYTSRVSKQLTDARERNMIPWEWIVDETRHAERVPAWDDPGEFAAHVGRQYRRDNWSLQGAYVEIWSEKGTMRGTLMPILLEYGVTFRVLHGFSSATTAYNAAQRIQYEREANRRVVIFYIGDWDPSGLFMSEEDLPQRLRQYGAEPTEFQRIAIIADDIRDSTLPSFQAADKRKDPRYRWFISRYGQRCWEVDALSPVVLRDRLTAAIRREIDWASWDRCLLAEAAETESLKSVLAQWSAIMHWSAE